MRVSSLLSVLALAGCAGKRTEQPLPQPPANVREYDWSRAHLLSEVPLSRFRTARIVVTGLNPLCYDYKHEFQTKAVDPPNIDAFKSLLGIAEASKKKEGGGPPAGAIDPHPLLPATTAGSAGARNLLPALADSMRDVLLLAREALAAARAGIASADIRVAAVGENAKEVAEAACNSAVAFTSTLASWRAAHSESGVLLEEAAGHLKLASTRLDEARRHVAKAEAMEGRLQRNRDYARQMSDEDTYAGILSSAIGKLAREIGEAEESYSETDETIIAVRSAVLAADASIRGLEHASSLPFDVRPGLADGRYEVSVIATPKPSQKDLKASTQKFTVNVSNTLRVMMSAGFAFAPLEAPVHARTNRPWLTPDSAGKTFSTYDISDREELAYAPMLLVTGMFTQVGPIPVGLSFGAAVREVRSKKGIDFLAGPTFSVQDHVFLTLGYYNSRREYLRLGDAKTVSLSPVATSISDADAIGVERGGSFGFSVSFKN
jgi:hypothetical protein